MGFRAVRALFEPLRGSYPSRGETAVRDPSGDGPADRESSRSCPVCGDPMDAGFVLAIAFGSRLVYTTKPLTLGWLAGPARGRGMMDQVRSEPLAEASTFAWGGDPRFAGWRCAKCQRVEFSYSTPVYRAADEPPPP